MSVFLGGQNGAESAANAQNAYSTDLYLYITGRHPLLCAGLYNDYVPENRDITISSSTKKITVRDNNIWGVM